MVVIVIIQDIRISIRSRITGTHLPISTQILFAIHLYRCLLHQRTIQVTQLFRRDTGRKRSYVRPQPGIITIVLIHLISAYSQVDLMFTEVIGHNFTDLRHGVVGNLTQPDRMRTGIGFYFIVYFTMFGYIRIHPEVQPYIPVEHLFGKAGSIREAGFIPFIGTRISFTMPSRFKADHGKRKSAFLKFIYLFLYIVIGKQSRCTMPETQSPTRRQSATTIIQIVTANDILHGWPRKENQFHTLCGNQDFDIVGIRLRRPGRICITVLFIRGIRSFANGRSYP